MANQLVVDTRSQRRLPWLASKLHANLASRAGQDVDQIDSILHRLDDRLIEVGRSIGQRRRSRIHRWDLAAESLSRQIQTEIELLSDLLSNTTSVLSGAVPSPTVSAREILDELQSLEDSDEFVDFVWDRRGGLLSVTTEPIELEGLSLGRFQIDWNYKRLLEGRRADSSLFSTVALDPSPPSSEESITHPHVRDDTPCLGDAIVAINSALQQGRIGDAFRLVDRVLHTYNRESAYRRLDEWEDRTCEDCGDSVESDSMGRCQGCDHEVCHDCQHHCGGCDDWFCRSCVERTSDEEMMLCDECRGRCSQCDGIGLKSEFENRGGLCASCESNVTETKDDEQSDASDDLQRETNEVKTLSKTE